MTMLRNIREKKGLTVSQLAARAGIASRTIMDYEEGRQPLALNHARLIAKALWVPIEDLMPPAGTVVVAGSQPSQSRPAEDISANQIAQPPPGTPSPVSAIIGGPPQPVAAGSVSSTSYAPSPAPRPQTEYPPYQREARPVGRPEGSRGRGGNGGPPEGRGGHGEKKAAPHPPGPISEGQLEELSRLAGRLEISRDQLEAQIGKPISTLARPDAKDWIKKLRSIADELAPTQKARFGTWPEAQQDREAAYLREQQSAGAALSFMLFNGTEFQGTVADYTPYTITVTDASGEETILRKLAIAYYRRLPGVTPAQQSGGPAEASTSTPTTAAANTDATAQAAPTEGPITTPTLTDPLAADVADAVSLPAESHQPLDEGIDSDRAGEPVTPEHDNMDEDRGV